MATDFPCMDDSPLNNGHSYRDDIDYNKLPEFLKKEETKKIIFKLTSDGILKKAGKE